MLYNMSKTCQNAILTHTNAKNEELHVQQLQLPEVEVILYREMRLEASMLTSKLPNT